MFLADFCWLLALTLFTIHQKLETVSILCIWSLMIPVLVISLYADPYFQAINGILLCASNFVLTAIALQIFVMRAILDREHGSKFLDLLATRRAKRRMEGKQERPKTLLGVSKKAFLATLPTTFILVVLLTYVLVIFAIFNSTESNAIKVFYRVAGVWD